MDGDREAGIGLNLRGVAAMRLGIGLGQGLIAWWLLELVPPVTYGQPEKSAAELVWWSHQHPMPFAILALLTAFVPTVALAEAGRMRGRALARYLAALTVFLAALAAYDIWRDPLDAGWRSEGARIWPSATLVFCAGAGVFIVNQVLEHRERGFALYRDYDSHFEDSWMRGFQFAISLAFTLLVWGVLELGKGLFDMIHLDWFGRMIGHNWFRCPVLAVAFAASVHITDVRPALLKGMRNLGLTLLGWLLPLVVLLGWGFLVALGFTGLAPLWSTRFAASLLLSLTAVTLVLLNAAYKDGDPANAPVAPVRWAGRAAGPMMLAMTLLAVIAIGFRVGQHGWTPQRIRSGAVAAMALVYACGYTWAALDRAAWLQRLERANVTASIALLGVLALLVTPIADPARLAVNSQAARLHAGTIAPDKFDYQLLRFDTGRYGTAALAALASDPLASIASHARLAQALKQRDYGCCDGGSGSRTEPPLAHATIYPAAAALPKGFPPTDPDNGFRLDDCLSDGSPCDIILWNGSSHGEPLVIVKLTARDRVGEGMRVFGRELKGTWQEIGQLQNGDCPGALDALRTAKIEAVRPLHDDLMANGVRLRFKPANSIGDRCPAPAKAPTPPSPPRDASAPPHMGPGFGNPGAM